MGPAPLGGSHEGGKVFTHEGSPSLVETGGGGGAASEPQRRAQQQECRGQSGEISAHKSVLTSTHQPERLVCSPARAGGGWELRLRLRRSDPRERTRVGYVNTA